MSADVHPDMVAFTRTDVEVRLVNGQEAVILTSSVEGGEPQEFEVGRVVGGAFQPAMFADYALSPRVLREIADALEDAVREVPC